MEAGGKIVRKMTYKRKLAAGIFCLFAGFFLYLVSVYVPGAAKWYAGHIYPVIVASWGRIFGAFPFSCAELLLYAGIILLFWSFFRMLFRIYKRRSGACVSWLTSVFLAASLLFLVYMLNCGINYHRDSFASYAGLELSGYTMDDLELTCRILTGEVNQYAKDVKREADGTMSLSGDYRQEAVDAMEKLGTAYPVLQGYFPKPKPLALSEFLSVQSLTGIYSPFTVEANFNQDMTDYNIPFTVCHELAHLRGFMQEEEANFIAYLACRNSDSIQFRYSGSLLAWIHATNELKKYDEAVWKELREQLEQDVITDLQKNSEFWDTYEGTIAEVSEQVNDTYLRANGQVDGVNSYNRMVDLLVAYFTE